MEENLLLHRLMDLFEFKSSFQQQTSGIPPQDMFILERIGFAGEVQGRDLSRAYGIPPSTLTGILDRLEKKRAIRRERKDGDRRAVVLVLTEAGGALLSRHGREDALFARNLFRALPEEKRGPFLNLLRELLDGIQKERLFEGRMEERGGVPDGTD